MMRALRMGFLPGLLIAVGSLATGCANQMSYGEMKPLIPALQSDQGRIFFYRESRPLGMGDLLSPDIRLNDEVVGASNAGSFFFVDRPPGSYEIACGGDVVHKATLSLAAGQEVYVSTQLGPGILTAPVIPEQVEPVQAIAAIHGLHYVSR